MKILVTPTSLQPGTSSEALNTLKEFSDDLLFNPYGRPLNEEELIPLLSECEGYIAGLDYITARVLENCPHLKVISRYGAGYDRVDLQAAKNRGISVTNTPGANAEAVGELAIALVLAVARRIASLDTTTKKGDWVRSTGMELKGKTMGIVGLGSIGKIVARCAQGFQMKVIAYDPFIDADSLSDSQILSCTLEQIYEQADVISLHLPLNDATRHLIGQDALSKMKSSAIIINTSRGGIIDENAVYHALKEGRLGGLGLDVFELEPPKDSPLFSLDNVVVTPHTGAHTREATLHMADLAVKNLIDVLSGNDCPYIVNR